MRIGLYGALIFAALVAPGCSSSPEPAEDAPPAEGEGQPGQQAAASQPSYPPVIAVTNLSPGAELPPIFSPVPEGPPPPPREQCDHCYDRLKIVGWLGHRVMPQ